MLSRRHDGGKRMKAHRSDVHSCIESVRVSLSDTQTSQSSSPVSSYAPPSLSCGLRLHASPLVWATPIPCAAVLGLQIRETSQDPTGPHTTTVTKFFVHCTQAHYNDSKAEYKFCELRTRACRCSGCTNIA